MSSIIGKLGPRMVEIHMWFLEAKVEAKTEPNKETRSFVGSCLWQ
jgi:hypothetical protein